MSRKQRVASLIPRFTFSTTANKSILVPLEIFEFCFENPKCAFVECFVAYPKQAYQRAASGTFAAFASLCTSENCIELPFEYNFAMPHVMVKIEAKDAMLTTFMQKTYCGKMNIPQLVTELACSQELLRVLQVAA